jgi:hypothetical protein
MMQTSDQVSHYPGETAIRIDVHSVGVNLNQHDICRSQTYIYQPFPRILQNMNGFASPESTVLHRPILPYSSRVGTRYSRHLSTPNAQLSFHIMEWPEVLRLTEGMQLSTFNLDQQVYNRMVLNRHRWDDAHQATPAGLPTRHISCSVPGHYPYPVRRHNHVPPLSQFRYLTLTG